MGFKYKVGDRTVELEERDDKVAVRFTEPSPHSHRAAVASSANTDFQRRLELPGEKYTVLPAAPGAARASARAEAAAAAAAPAAGVARVAPVFRHGSTDVVATDRVLVGLANEADPIEPLLADLRKVEVKACGYGEYVVRLAEDVDPLKVAEMLSDRPGVRYAEPDFVHIGPRPGIATAQDASAATGQPGAVPGAGPADTADGPNAAVDVGARQYAMRTTRAIDAWALVAGKPQISIAVLDEGVDTRHGALKDQVIAGYDAIDGDEFQDPNPWNGHGTACAGLAAGVLVGPHGMKGVASGCSLVAVRIAQSPFPGADWVWSTGNVADGIDWSWRQGADVLSNSWVSTPSNRISSALARAMTEGRGGRGCVVVIAAGNFAEAVSYPGTLEGVLTVSACNERDEFKTRTSSDGETHWGSNFGPEIGIAAPGVHNYTTDITAAGGYDGTDYYARFNGTSSATPLVAGAAALVLCARPDLSGAEVMELLRATADKVGTEPYINGRNDQFGHGRLNVLAAVQQALGHWIRDT